MSKESTARYLELRNRLWAATGDSCWYCGEPGREDCRTIDHVIPRGFEGSSEDETNLRPCCMRCNGAKGTRTVEDLRRYLAWLRTGRPYFTPVQLAWLNDNGWTPPAPFEFHGERLQSQKEATTGNPVVHPSTCPGGEDEGA